MSAASAHVGIALAPSLQLLERLMSIEDLEQTAQQMVALGKGIIAIDESNSTIKKRFDAVKVVDSEENRRAYREMLLTTPKLSEHISGAILYDETLRQSTKSGQRFADYMLQNGIIPGIKVDKGTAALAGFPGELVTEGLDGLRARLEEYAKLGAKFAKWRAVITISEDGPSSACIHANTHALARYAALCQEVGIVPMVEPEVLMDGEHDIDVSYDVTEATLRSLYDELYTQNVLLEGTILKASMVISGKDNDDRASREEVAEMTLRCLKSTVPSTVPGIVFHPWPISFSYGRAMQSAALKIWAQDTQKNVAEAQKIVFARARDNGLAAVGKWRSK
jgi:fructose-bisphosphate aldolase, class I